MRQHIFLHIPKTAGSSIRTLIQQNYPADATIGFSGDPAPLAWWATSPRAFKDQYQLVHGHFPYGVHANVSSHTYFTFLRDPVDRHFSDYFFLKRYEAHPMHEAIASGRITLSDWARIHENTPMYRDMSTRIVSGRGDDEDPNPALLEMAKRHLATDFSFVGLAERFDESVLILAKRLGWKAVFYLTKNVSANRAALDPALRAAAKPGFAHDFELYDYGRRMFEASPELQDPLFDVALAELRDGCAWLAGHLANDSHAIFEVGFELPALATLVRQHRSTPALDRFLGLESRHAA